jgi:hypothetical protein
MTELLKKGVKFDWS